MTLLFDSDNDHRNIVDHFKRNGINIAILIFTLKKEVLLICSVIFKLFNERNLPGLLDSFGTKNLYTVISFQSCVCKLKKRLNRSYKISHIKLLLHL